MLLFSGACKYLEGMVGLFVEGFVGFARFWVFIPRQRDDSSVIVLSLTPPPGPSCPIWMHATSDPEEGGGFCIFHLGVENL